MNKALFGHEPQPVDVIIRRDSHQTRRYLIGSLEHRSQLICASRNAAIAHGTRYAMARGVCVWQADRERFKLIFSPLLNGQESPH